jgi:hypothetical protein
MLQRFSNEQLARYPRMSPDESILWGKFLAEHGKEYDRFDYDLRVGQGAEAQENIPENLRKDWRDLTKPRIDAVGYKGLRATIFEVKTRPTVSTLGQLLGYRTLFLTTYKQYMVDGLALVCESIGPDVGSVIAGYGIAVYKYPSL